MENNLPSIETQTILFALLAVLLPLLAFFFNMLLPAKLGRAAGTISTIAILLSCVLSVSVFARVWNTDQIIHQKVLWFTIGNTKIYAGILLNNLSVLMLLLVNLISLTVHIYSTAYMQNDEHYSRYFAYLSFFCFSMLALVMADNMILFYAFWELVGFSSYLLIGFWFKKDKAVQANKKAFIMNRIGDIGLLIAIIIFFIHYHTFDIQELFGRKGMVFSSFIEKQSWYVFAPGFSNTSPVILQYIAVAGIILAVAAKSAQFPLHTWLPDAMEGPTSVSALIHAATMVAAGVFLLGRVYPIFNGTELTILAIIGCFTAFMAATIALTQNDLKRILAYSTISQLGFMVMAMGVGAYAGSIFHLFTHAFFKCLLFLVAGIVIHQMQHIKEESGLSFDAQDINNMGGLRKKLPLTFLAAILGGAALIGLPLTSGFLSKDGILVKAFEWSNGKNAALVIIPVMAIITTLLTAFYVARLIIKVFFGELQALKQGNVIKPHFSDGSWSYKLPLVFLSIACLFLPFAFNPFSDKGAWLLGGFDLVKIQPIESSFQILVPVIVNLLSIATIYLAFLVYGKRRLAIFPQRGFLFRFSFNQWYFNQLYNRVFVKPVLAISKKSFWFDHNVIDGFLALLTKIVIGISNICAWFDKHIIDGFLHLLVSIAEAIGNFARKFQGGKVQYYIFSMLVIILTLFILKTIF